MSIKDFSEKIKDFARLGAGRLGPLSDDLFLGLIIVLVAIGAFGLGRLSKIEGSKAPIRIENEPAQTASTFSQKSEQAGDIATQTLQGGQSNSAIIASKTGTKYYYSWCTGAQKISEANRIYFSSLEQAKAAGYTPSGTCKGL